MFKLTLTKCIFASAWLFAVLPACNNGHNALTAKQNQNESAPQVKALIVKGRAAESGQNDSLKSIATQLYKLSEQSDNKEGLVWAELFETDYYWQNSDHQQAMKIAMQCLADAEKFNITQANVEIYGSIANLFKETGQYPQAFKNAEAGLKLAIASKDTAHMIALLGLKAMFTRSSHLFKNQPGPDNSIDLNLAALKIAESSPKYAKIRTRFYDNICQYYKDQKDYQKAFYYGNKGVANALKFNQQRSLTYAYAWLGQANYFNGNHDKGIGYLNQALEIASNLKEPYRVMELHGHIYDCYLYTENYKDALTHYRRMWSMRDSLKVVDNGNKITELQTKYQTAQKDKEIMDLNAKALLRNALVVILVLLCVIIGLIYNRERKRKALAISERMRVDEELNSAVLELQYFTENLRQKNEIIEEFKSEIEHLQLQNISAADKENLDSLVNAHIMTDENWNSFRRLFGKVHTGFFESIKKKYPNLTASDARILSLIKLELSNNEMANMLGITLEGIKKSKQRLRKKMELDKDESLESVLADI
jgi:tetratricopeptide (TPR) repeat protein